MLSQVEVPSTRRGSARLYDELGLPVILSLVHSLCQVQSHRHCLDKPCLCAAGATDNMVSFAHQLPKRVLDDALAYGCRLSYLRP